MGGIEIVKGEGGRGGGGGREMQRARRGKRK